MPHPLKRLVLALALLAGASAWCAETAAPALITATDLFKLKQLEAPALSPDGKLVVYVVRSIEPKPEAKDDWTYRTQLWLAATDGSAPPRQLTFGQAGNSSPAWSPQGDRLAFVRGIEKEKPQIYLLSLAGGEAQPLTKLETGAGNPRWSPDGANILFTSSLSYAQVRDALEKAGKETTPAWSPEKAGRKANDTANWNLKSADKDKAKDEIRPEPKASAKPDGTLQEMREWLARNEADGSPRVTDRLNFIAEGDLTLDPSFTQLYTIKARDGAEPAAAALGYAGLAGAEWSPDGKSIYCTGPRKADEHPDRLRFDSLYRIDATTGARTVLLEELGSRYAEPVASPDGKSIAFILTTGGEFSFEQPVVAVMPAAGGQVKMLTTKLDRSATNLQWSPDGTFIYFSAPTGGGFPLYRVPAAGGAVEKLTGIESGVRDYNLAGTTLAYVLTRATNPYELFAAAPDAKGARELTTHNSSWLTGRKLSAYEPHRLENKEGITVDYWTLKPADFDAKKKYPLLLNIHGGPTAMWGPGEDTMWFEFQFFTARGYTVLFANPRGSGGYGRDFQRANFKDWGPGPSSDILAAASFTAKEPFVDKGRQVVTGGSYGGYMVAWIVGHDHRFKAAVAQRGVYDLATFYGEGNAWFLVPLYWGGYPWEPEVRHLLDRDSPLTYVANIKTPLLIQHGDVDFRTGFVQSQILYKSLKQMGRDVEYARYPRATHELSRSGEPKQRLDTLVRYEEFFRRYIGENP
ncbi:MAG: S9 family peptidase [bacterium]|nr:S9 family peptidase [bacterium]